MKQGFEKLSIGLAGWASDSGPTVEATGLLETAETLLESGSPSAEERDAWLEYLDKTRRPEFLLALPDDRARMRWAETTFPLIEHLGFGFEKTGKIGKYNDLRL